MSSFVENIAESSLLLLVEDGESAGGGGGDDVTCSIVFGDLEVEEIQNDDIAEAVRPAGANARHGC